MKLYSTNDPTNIVDLQEAILTSLPVDRGLYMPSEIPVLPASFFSTLGQRSFADNSLEVAAHLIGDYIPLGDLQSIIHRAVDFAAPVVMHDDRIGALELFHGPSLAFKDFGARFMAEMISYFQRGEDRDLTILVATSGDTGGAVAAGFLDTPGIEVIILYPSGKVSMLQEKQLTTLGGNITALEIDGTFDDCQSVVKQAFVDADLQGRYRLSSANSINIARLIPQSFYYFEAYKQVSDLDKEVVVAVPSGNFGNLTAGLFAKRMGLPISRFIAATNINNVVPAYLDTGQYNPRPSRATISNAMDVGAPSNFARMMALYGNNVTDVRRDVSGYYLDDDGTRAMMRHIYDAYSYIADPHGAIGYGALRSQLGDDQIGIYLETAHPAKFATTVSQVLGVEPVIPERLRLLADREKVAHRLSQDYNEFKSWMLDRR